MNKQIALMIFIFAITIVITPAYAKRGVPNPVASIVNDGIEYSAPLHIEDIGCVVATWQKTKRVIWRKQVYVIKHEYKRGLEPDVQDVYISKLRLLDNRLLITNEYGDEYELDLNSLNVKVLKGKAVIDYTTWNPSSHSLRSE